MSHSAPQAEVAADADLASLARLAMEQAGFEPHEELGPGELLVPPRWRDDFGGRAHIAMPSSQSVEAAETPSAAELREWLRRTRSENLVWHGAPVDQPASVHQLTAALFAPYDVEGGRVLLSGCSLEDRPFLRLTWSDDTSGRSQLRHLLFHENAELLEPELAERLAVDCLAPHGPAEIAAAEITPAEIEAWRRACLEHDSGGASVGHDADLLAVTLIWCKYAVGQIEIRLGEETVHLPFAGWARDLARGYTLPPPYACPLSGRSSYNLVADGRGRIVAAEALARCEMSGRQVVETELERCLETGRRVLPEHLATCEESGNRVLRNVLQPCLMCRRGLAPAVLEKGVCPVCRNVQEAGPGDPRVQQLLEKYPALTFWKKWRVGETPQRLIFLATSTLQQLLIVSERANYHPIRVATKSRLWGRWSELPMAAWRELFGE